MKTSIVILTYNQLHMTIHCLESIRRNTPEDYEIIVIDNGSTDETVTYMKTQTDVILHENTENLGFGKGCNQGIECASGDQILFLNNDTIVTKHWLENMLDALYSHERVGMVGPVTNYSSGHQIIPVPYTELSGIDAFAESYCKENAGKHLEVRRLIGFCLLAKRSVLDEIGWFDEQFGLGNYEDDDLCLRAIRKGYSLLVAQDSFIHHFGHATMNQLPTEDLRTLLDKNGKKATEKWGNNIHQLIYKPAIRVSLCMIVCNAEPSIRHTLVSLADLVDEIIIVDTGSTDQTLEIASQYTPHVFSFVGAEGNPIAYQYAFDVATNDYILWLHAGDVLDCKEKREFSGLKLSVDNEVNIITMTVGGATEQPLRYLIRKDGGFMPLEHLERNLQVGSTLDSGIQIKHMA
ncbi:glycosyltransferase family 2 protein [Paenibacillus sp. IHBB 10380]|uniref:glycosyltransferase family 2 protein n=1 Tax=Paenibacillus sp. IHBB 10380 TaxID=1566358 RepID=UPI000695C8A0|nr:glycosyltransferase family 2 protein [Paenibacillus sp. IHBB 10380]